MSVVFVCDTNVYFFTCKHCGREFTTHTGLLLHHNYRRRVGKCKVKGKRNG